MILLGINDLARREQARELLAWGAERYWCCLPCRRSRQGSGGSPGFPPVPSATLI